MSVILFFTVGDFAEDIGRGAANDAIRKRMADATKDE